MPWGFFKNGMPVMILIGPWTVFLFDLPFIQGVVDFSGIIKSSMPPVYSNIYQNWGFLIFQVSNLVKSLLAWPFKEEAPGRDPANILKSNCLPP